MKRRVHILLLIGLLALGVAGHGMAAEDAGKPFSASSVKALDANGLLKIIADAKGKVVVVNIFASWCPPCREEVPGLISMRKSFAEKELAIVGVSVDKTPKALYAFMNDMSFNYPVFLAQNKFEETVGVTAIPQLLIYNKAGNLVVNHKGLANQDDLVKAVNTLLAE